MSGSESVNEFLDMSEQSDVFNNVKNVTGKNFQTIRDIEKPFPIFTFAKILKVSCAYACLN